VFTFIVGVMWLLEENWAGPETIREVTLRGCALNRNRFIRLRP
jgi:hypothetical protein